MLWLYFPSEWPSSQFSHQYFIFKIWNYISMLVSDKLYIFTRFLDLRAFAGFRGCFADFYGRFAGNFGRSYVYLYIYIYIYMRLVFGI